MKIKHGLLCLGFSLALGLVGCAKKTAAPPTAVPVEKEKEKEAIAKKSDDRLYESARCFADATETYAALEMRYATAVLRLNANATGAIKLNIYRDSSCTQMVSWKKIKFSRVSQVTVGDGSVFVMELERTIRNPRWYIPSESAPTGLYLDLDYADFSAGPYVTEPTNDELKAFRADPAREGVEFKEIEITELP